MTDAQTDAEIQDGLRELSRQGDPLVAQHYALPWLAATAGSSIVGIPIVGQRGRAIASLHFAPEGVEGRDAYNTQQLAMAAFIVRCVNAHDELVAALRYWLPDETQIPEGFEAAWGKAIALLARVKGEA